MKRILITGGAGFIGSHLTLALQKKFPDAFINVIDDFSSGSFKNLEGFRGDFITTSLTDLPADFNLTFDYVFHLASISDTRDANQQRQCFNNIEGFRALLSRVISSNKYARVIYASSASVYGIRTEETPFREDFQREPANIYAFTKCQLENLAEILAENMGISIYGVRFFNVYGGNEGHKGDYASMIRQIAVQAKEKGAVTLFEYGNQCRDFVHVDDVVEMMIRLMDYPATSRIFNCGSGEITSFNDVLSLVKEMNNCHPDYGNILDVKYVKCPYPFFQTYTCADMSLAKQELNFVPQHSNIGAIQKYIEAIYAS